MEKTCNQQSSKSVTLHLLTIKHNGVLMLDLVRFCCSLASHTLRTSKGVARQTISVDGLRKVRKDQLMGGQSVSECVVLMATPFFPLIGLGCLSCTVETWVSS